MFLEEELIIEEWFLKWMEKEFTVIPASIDELMMRVEEER